MTMAAVDELITEHIDIWTSAVKRKSSAGRGGGKKVDVYGVKKLRELILDLAVRGLLVPQDPEDEPASVLLERIALQRQNLLEAKKIKNLKLQDDVASDEAPYSIPSAWAWTRLGLIAEIGPRNYVEDSVLCGFVSMPSVTTNYDGSHKQEIRKWGEIKKGYTHFADGDIGLAKITPCFENSKAAVFGGLKNGVGAGTTELHIARPITNEVNQRYVLFRLKSPGFLLTGEKKMTGSAGQKRVPKSYFAEHPLPFPPIEEQHRIVAKVDELMALCDQLEQQTEASLTAHQTLVRTLLDALTQAAASQSNNSQSATDAPTPFEQAWNRLAEHFDTVFTTEDSIEQLKQTILQLAVMGKLVPQDPNDEPASELLERIAAEKAELVKAKKIKKQKALPEIGEDEKPFKLPEGWEWTKCQSICSKITDGEHSTPERSSSGHYLLSARNVTNEGIVLHNVDYVPTIEFERIRKRCDPNIGDILISCSGSIGRVALVDKDDTYSMVRSAAMIRPDCRNLYTEYLALMLKSPYLQQQMVARTRKSAQPNLFLGAISNLTAIIPPLCEQHRIVTKVEEFMSLCNQLKTRLTDAQTTQLRLADAVTDKYIQSLY